jgi:hypothetical protein
MAKEDIVLWKLFGETFNDKTRLFNIRRRTGFTNFLDENGRLPNGMWL